MTFKAVDNCRSSKDQEEKIRDQELLSNTVAFIVVDNCRSSKDQEEKIETRNFQATLWLS